MYFALPEISISSFDELISIVQKSKIPFIIRDFKLMDVDLESFENAIKREKNLFGYSNSMDWEMNYVNGDKLWNDFLTDKLTINVVDSPITTINFLSEEWDIYAKSILEDVYEYKTSYVLTKKDNETKFHIDPSWSGSYMFLKEGIKEWHLVTPEDWEYLKSQGVTLDNVELNQLQRVYKVLMKSNDFIWFPINTLHRVLTHEKSWGISGYL